MGHIALLCYVYSAILLIGGIIGYTRAKSSVSLIAGVASAVVGIIAGVLSANHRQTALALIGLLSLVMVIVFAMRYRKTGKPMPAMPMMVISVLVLLASGYELLKTLGAHTPAG